MIQVLLIKSGKLLSFVNKSEAIDIFQSGLNFHSNHTLLSKLDGHRSQIKDLIQKISEHQSDTPVLSQLSRQTVEDVFTAVRTQRSGISIYHITIPRLETDLQLIQDCISHKNRAYRVPMSYGRIIPVSMKDFIYHVQDIVLVLTPFNSLSKSDNQYLRNGISILSKSAKKHIDYGSKIVLYNMNSILNKITVKDLKKELVSAKH